MNIVSRFFAWLKSLFAPTKLADVIPIGVNKPIDTVSPVDLGTQDQYHRAIVNPSRVAGLQIIAKKILSSIGRYQYIEHQTGVPWWVVACIHNQEMGSDLGVFKACLHNGEKIIGTGRKTTLVPAGKGPFDTWEAAAIDALGGPGSHLKQDWSIMKALDWLERYNGLGYRNHKIPSPYIWAMTDQYVKGHYVADGKFDPEAVSKNTGCVAVMKMLGIT